MFGKKAKLAAKKAAAEKERLAAERAEQERSEFGAHGHAEAFEVVEDDKVYCESVLLDDVYRLDTPEILEAEIIVDEIPAPAAKENAQSERSGESAMQEHSEQPETDDESSFVIDEAEEPTTAEPHENSKTEQPTAEPVETEETSKPEVEKAESENRQQEVPEDSHGSEPAEPTEDKEQAAAAPADNAIDENIEEVSEGSEEELEEAEENAENEENNEDNCEVMIVVENPEEDDELVKPAKLVNLPNLVNYMLSLNLSKSMKMNVAMLLLSTYNKFKDIPAEKAILVKCIKKVMAALMN